MPLSNVTALRRAAAVALSLGLVVGAPLDTAFAAPHHPPSKIYRAEVNAHGVVTLCVASGEHIYTLHADTEGSGDTRVEAGCGSFGGRRLEVGSRGPASVYLDGRTIVYVPERGPSFRIVPRQARERRAAGDAREDAPTEVRTQPPSGPSRTSLASPAPSRPSRGARVATGVATAALNVVLVPVLVVLYVPAKIVEGIFSTIDLKC